MPACRRLFRAAVVRTMLALAEHGFETVVALDLSPAACKAATEEIGASTSKARGRIDVRCGDFFDLTGQYDFIWDNTFLCALEPEVRERWARQMKALLAPG